MPSCSKIKRNGWVYWRRLVSSGPHGKWEKKHYYDYNGVAKVSAKILRARIQKWQANSTGEFAMQYKFNDEYDAEMTLKGYGATWATSGSTINVTNTTV